MTRTVAREIAVQIVYSLADKTQTPGEALESFLDKDYFASLKEENALYADYPSRKQREYITSVVTGVFDHRDELDEYIEKYAKGWKLARISKTAQSALRVALFEVLYMPEVPNSVAINEAVELSKGYEEQETVSFINGILGSFMRGELGKEPAPVSAEEAATEAEESETEAEEPSAESEAPVPTEE